MRLLIIEDEQNLANILKRGFAENGFTVELSFDGEEGLYMAENYTYDAVLLDIMLPSIDGITILKTLRSKGYNTPILMLTAKGEVDDRIHGLNTGADDYIPKPFDFSELLARVRSAIRRDKGTVSPYIEAGDLIINTNSRTVKRAGKEIKLSAKEYNLLEYLVSQKNRVISRTEIIDHIYDSEFDLDSNIVDVFVNYLRNKIDKGFDKKLIKTVRGAGYVLSAE
ncbi:MAG: response regulator transcription factor [Nitrospiraceae bacterium]|nr:response regulator transcription factor [Nitrospiraceae bacterium]